MASKMVKRPQKDNGSNVTYCRWHQCLNYEGDFWTVRSNLYWHQHPGTFAVTWTCTRIHTLAVHTTAKTNRCQPTYGTKKYTCVQKKTPTYVFDYNSGISWSILILFVPMETGMNTLQYTYLISWWRHKYVTSHVTKVYFTELLFNIEYIEFWR